MTEFFKKHSWKLLISIALFLLAIAGFAAITNEVVMEKEENVDLLIFSFFKNHIIRNGLNGYMLAVTFFCSAIFIKFAYPVLLAVLVIFKQLRKAIFAFFAGAGGMILVFAIKTFFHRPRPPYPLLYKETGYSFPSGHATLSFVLYGTLAYFVWISKLPKFLKFLMIAFLLTLSFTIGMSRIYLMVHYPSDVFGGFCLGYSWLFLMIYIFRRWFPLD